MSSQHVARPTAAPPDRPAPDRPAPDRPATGQPVADRADVGSGTPIDRWDATAISAAIGAIAGLAILKLTMLAALFAAVEPHPPRELAPLFGASLALSALAVVLLRTRSALFLVPVVPVAIESLVSYGPHKFFVGQSIAIYPAVAVGSTLVVVLALASWRLLGSPRVPRVSRAVAAPLAAS